MKFGRFISGYSAYDAPGRPSEGTGTHSSLLDTPRRPQSHLERQGEGLGYTVQFDSTGGDIGHAGNSFANILELVL